MGLLDRLKGGVSLPDAAILHVIQERRSVPRNSTSGKIIYNVTRSEGKGASGVRKLANPLRVREKAMIAEPVETARQAGDRVVDTG
jgi:hypothetical protein